MKPDKGKQSSSPLSPHSSMTFYLWSLKLIRIISSSRQHMPSLIKIHPLVWSLSRSQDYSHFCQLLPLLSDLDNQFKGSSSYNVQHFNSSCWICLPSLMKIPKMGSVSMVNMYIGQVRCIDTQIHCSTTDSEVFTISPLQSFDFCVEKT